MKIHTRRSLIEFNAALCQVLSLSRHRKKSRKYIVDSSFDVSEIKQSLTCVAEGKRGTIAQPSGVAAMVFREGHDSQCFTPFKMLYSMSSQNVV